MEIYIKTVRKAYILKRKTVLIRDIAEVYAPENLKSYLENTIVMEVKGDKKSNYVISNIQVIKAVIDVLPECKINMLGEMDTIIEYLPKDLSNNKFWLYSKIIFASVILFAGAATAIMSFHTDAQIPEILEKYYHMFFGDQESKAFIIEIPYSIGLAVGIIVFYNHFFKWKFTDDPTPLQVEMTLYEQDVDGCILDNLIKEKRSAK